MNKQNYLFFLKFFAITFLLTVAGCGGGGGGGTSAPPPPTTADSLIWDQGNWQEKNWN